MPIYEYLCQSCNQHFEKLIRGGTEEVACPSCGQTQVRRLLSSFAVGRSPSSTASFSEASEGFCPCGKTPGSCSMN
ncbi:MAG TPA: zinc ribbon domain-containing protein [Candidatus Nitrosotenuis sp.]|jgi:putative FmdB family regulatory protein|nr:zinc ribbon domain-containing protein [Candidatus Nitrosotenuis sp.]